MLIRRSIIFIYSIAGLIASSCSPLYLPNAVNTPLLTGKGEFQASAYAGISGIDPQLAYAVTDNMGLMLNASIPIFDQSEHKYPFIEMGVGYYKRVGGNGLFEIYGGGGYRSLKSMEVQNYYSEDYYSLSENFLYSTRFFIQPSIGATSKLMDVSFTPRIILVNMVDEFDMQTGIFFEPTITVKIGFEYVRFVLQGGSSTSFSKEIPFNYQPLFFSGGIQVNLNRLYE